MTTTDANVWGHKDGRPWKARLHRAASLLVAVITAAIALHWVLSQTIAPIAPDADLRFIDAFAITLTSALFALALGVAWRMGAGRR